MNLTATFRIVTPLFLGGADPLAEAELRPASVKGALRFWWRALAWTHGINTVANLRAKEAELFGSSETGQSKVRLLLETPLVSQNRVSEKWQPASWQRYTGYGLRDKGERCFIPSGREFTVSFATERCNAAQHAEIVAYKIILLVLGEKDLEGLSTMRQGRNSNGKPRPEKYLLDLEEIETFTHIIIKL